MHAVKLKRDFHNYDIVYEGPDMFPFNIIPKHTSSNPTYKTTHFKKEKSYILCHLRKID